MTETARQEIDLQFGGHNFTVRPDFTVLSSIEAATNMSARTLGMKALSAGLPPSDRANVAEISITELALVIYWMLRGKKNAPASPTEVGNVLMEDGYNQYLMPVGMFLVRGFRGNKEHEKEAAQATAQSDP